MVQAIYANAWVRQSYQQAADRKVNPTSSEITRICGGSWCQSGVGTP